MSLTEAELSVERDWLLEHGRSVEEVEAMQRNADGEMERLVALWVYGSERPGVDYACGRCLEAEEYEDHSTARPGFLCLWHRGEDLLSRAENAAGASALRAPGETR